MCAFQYFCRYLQPADILFAAERAATPGIWRRLQWRCTSMKGRQLVVLLLLLAIPFFLFAAQQTTYMGKKVTYLEFPIAGGEKISVPVTDTGAIPAETAEFKIEAAGVALRDLKTHPTFSWGFALTVKSDEPLQRAKIRSEEHTAELQSRPH